MWLLSFCTAGRPPGGAFSWFDLRVGEPDVTVVESGPAYSASSAAPSFSLLGNVGDAGLERGEPMVGRRRMAFSKTWGRSNAPGGWWCLLGLPWGVCCGLMKASAGVPGRSILLPRVWRSGGGTGSGNLSLLWWSTMVVVV